MENLTIELPKGFMNVGISSDHKWLTADTNDSANWDTLKFPLPKGNWQIQKIENKKVTLAIFKKPDKKSLFDALYDFYANNGYEEVFYSSPRHKRKKEKEIDAIIDMERKNGKLKTINGKIIN